MDDAVKDEVGTLESKDAGMADAAGMIGRARRFPGRQGVFGGDKIADYPAGDSPHRSAARFRAEKPNATILAWGNEQAQGKVVMQYPNIQHYDVFQIWPNSCSMGGNRHSDMLRDVQRRLPRLYSNMSVMSTLGIKPVGPCLFPPAGYAELAKLVGALVERDKYGKVFDKSITAPDVKRAHYTSGKKDEIALEFDQPMAWNDALTSQFYLDGKEGRVAAGAASGNVIKLKLATAGTAKTITHLADKKWDPKNLLTGANGIAALTFCEVPLAPARPAPLLGGVPDDGPGSPDRYRVYGKAFSHNPRDNGSW